MRDYWKVFSIYSRLGRVSVIVDLNRFLLGAFLYGMQNMLRGKLRLNSLNVVLICY